MLSKDMAEQMQFVFLEEEYEFGERMYKWMIIHPYDYRGVEVLMRPHVDPNGDSELARDARHQLAWEFERRRWFVDINLN